MGVESHDPKQLVGDYATPRLRNKIALITGAARGIGLAIARAFAREGAFLALVDKDPAGLDAAAADLRGLAASVEVFPADVSRTEQVDALVLWMLGSFGRLDAVVNNAGIFSQAGLEETADEEWDQIMGVNLRGTFLVCRSVLPHLREQGSGRVVNIAAACGRSARESVGGVAYSVSQAGVLHLTRLLAHQYAPYGVTVNAIAPGPIQTDLLRTLDPAALQAAQAATPFGRLGRPEDVAAAAVFLASDESAFITGEVLGLNGGGVIL